MAILTQTKSIRKPRKFAETLTVDGVDFLCTGDYIPGLGEELHNVEIYIDGGPQNLFDVLDPAVIDKIEQEIFYCLSPEGIRARLRKVEDDLARGRDPARCREQRTELEERLEEEEG